MPLTPEQIARAKSLREGNSTFGTSNEEPKKSGGLTPEQIARAKSLREGNSTFGSQEASEETVTTEEPVSTEEPLKKKEPTKKWDGGGFLSESFLESGVSESESEEASRIPVPKDYGINLQTGEKTVENEATIGKPGSLKKEQEFKDLSTEQKDYLKKKKDEKEFNSFTKLKDHVQKNLFLEGMDFFVDESGNKIARTPENQTAFDNYYVKNEGKKLYVKLLENTLTKIEQARQGSSSIDSQGDNDITSKDVFGDALKAKELIFDKASNIAYKISGFGKDEIKILDEYNDIRKQIRDGDDYDIKRFDELEGKVAQLRESSNKLLDQYGKLEGGEERPASMNAKQVGAKYDNDFEKIAKALEEAIFEHEVLMSTDIDASETLTPISSYDKNVIESERQTKLDKLKSKKKAEIVALTQAVLLNEDITKRGDDTFAPIKVIRDFTYSLGETLAKEFTGLTPASDREFKKIFVKEAQEAGLKLSEEQLSSSDDNIVQKIGDAVGISTKIGLEIVAASLVTKNFGSALLEVKNLAKIKDLYETNSKAKYLINAVRSGINFEVASEQTSFAMGATESALGDYLTSVIAKLKPLKPIIQTIVRSFSGATATTIEEYGGDFADAMFKDGLSDETFKKVFGKSVEEGLEKLSIIFTMGLMTSGTTQGALLLSKSYKEAEAKNPDSETVKDMKDNLDDLGIDPDKVLADTEKKVRKANAKDNVYPDGKGGEIASSDMTTEEEQAKRKELGYEVLTDEEIEQSKADLDVEEEQSKDKPKEPSVYKSTSEEELDTRILDGDVTEEEAVALSKERTTLSEDLGKSYRTKEGLVTTIDPKAKVEDGTVLRVPVSQLTTETEVEGKKESKAPAKSFKDALSGIIHVWKNPTDGSIEVVDGKARVDLAKSQDVDNMRVQFIDSPTFDQAVTKSDAINNEAEVGAVFSELSNENNQTAEMMRSGAKKVDALIKKLDDNTYSTLFGVEPLVAKLFLKGLKGGLEQSANFVEAVAKAIEYVKESDSYKNLSTRKQKDSIDKIRKNFGELKGSFTMASEPTKPKTKTEKTLIERDLTRKIDYITSKKLTDTVPTVDKVAQLAMKNGLTNAEALDFADRYKKHFNSKQANNERFARMRGEKKGLEGLELEQFIMDSLGKKPSPKSFKQAFLDITNAVLRDKGSQLKISEVINKALLGIQAKGVKFTTKQLSQISNGIKNINVANLGSVYDFVQRVEKIVKVAEFTAISSNIRSLQSKAKKKNKKDIPLNQRKAIAIALTLSPRKVGNVLELEALTQNILDYLNGTQELDRSIETKVDAFMEQSERYDEVKAERLEEAMYESYLKSEGITSDNLSLTEYLNFIKIEKSDAETDFEESSSNDPVLSKKRQRLEDLATSAMDEIKNTYRPKDWTSLNNDTFNRLLELIKSAELEDLTNDQLKMIVRVNNEIQMYGKLSGAGTLIAEASGVVKMKKNAPKISGAIRTFNNFIKEKIYKLKGDGFTSKTMSLGRYLDRVFIGKKAQEIGSLLIADYKFGLNKAKNFYYEFNERFENAYQGKISGKSKISNSENLDIGAKAYLLSSPKGLTELEAEFLFQEKIAKIKKDIETLKAFSKKEGTGSSDKKKAKELIKAYEKVFQSVKDETHASLTDKYNKNKLFNLNQSKAFELAKSHFSHISKELESSNELFGKAEFIMEDNYTGISYINIGGLAVTDKKNELDNEFQVRGIDKKESGSKISKVSPSAIDENKILNFNFLEVTQRRMQDQLLDVYTLGAKLELRSMVNSKYFRNQFKDNVDVYKGLVDKLSDLLKRQNVNTIFKLSKDASVENLIFNSINKAKMSALGTPGQFLKQATVLSSTAIRFGARDYLEGQAMWSKLMLSKEGRRSLKLLLEGSDTSNRSLMGDARLKETMDKMSKLFLNENKGVQTAKQIGRTIEKGLNLGLAELKLSDLMASEITYLTAFINLQKKEGKYKNGDGISALLKGKTKDNTFKADQLHAQINNESDTAMQGEYYAGDESKAKIISMILLNFQAHSNNNMLNMINSMLNILEPRLSKEEKYENFKSLTGGIAQMLAFRVVSEVMNGFKKSGYYHLMNAVGLKYEVPDDEKQTLERPYKDILEKELWTRVAINFTADMVSSRLPSGVFGTGSKLVSNWTAKLLHEHFTNEKPKSNLTVYEGEQGLGALSMVYDNVMVAGSLLTPYARSSEADNYKDSKDLIFKSKEFIEKHVNLENMGDVRGGEATRKLGIIAEVAFSLGGYGYAVEGIRKFNRQLEKSLKDKDYKKLPVL